MNPPPPQAFFGFVGQTRSCAYPEPRPGRPRYIPRVDPRLDAMVEAARAGGAVALAHYQGEFAVSLKPDRSPVTEADREAERTIAAVLRARCPDHGALGEELGESGPRGRRFIIDPIDGTRNFVRRVPTWAVLIGLEEEGVVTAGVVFQPVSAVLHTAWRGQGAWRDGRRIRVSPVDTLDRALVVHSSVNFLRRSPYWEGFLDLADRTQVQRGFGDFSAYLWVAEGQGEIALSTTVKAWDVAALKVLVEEAGGRLTDLDGRPGIHGTTVLASNGLLHDEALAVMAPVSVASPPGPTRAP